LILAPKDGTLVGVANMQEYFFPLWKLGGGFKDVAVTTTYVDNITGLRWSYCSGTAGPAVGPATHQQETQVITYHYNGIASPACLQYTNLAGVA
jgi:hypothetical protein